MMSIPILLVLLPVVMRVNTADASGSRCRRYNIAPPFFTSMRYKSPITAHIAFVDRRKAFASISLLRGGEGDDGQEVGSDSASSQPQHADGNNSVEGEGDVWEEVIRNTREYYSRAPKSSSSSSSSSSKLATSTIASQGSPPTSATTAITTDTVDAPTPITTTAAISNGEDGRVFGNSNTECDNNNFEQDQGQGGYDTGDTGNTTSTTIIGKYEKIETTMDDDDDDDGDGDDDDVVFNTINTDEEENTRINTEEGDETQVGGLIELELDEQRSGDGISENDEDITIQEKDSDGILSSQVEFSSTEIAKDGEGDDGNEDNEGMLYSHDEPLPMIDSEDSQAAVTLAVHHDGDIGEQVNEDLAAEDSSMKEGQALGSDPQTTVTEVNNQDLAGDDIHDVSSSNNDEKIQSQIIDLVDSDNGSIEARELKTVPTHDKFKELASQIIRKFQRRLSTLMMTCRRKEVRPILLTSMGIVLSLLLTSARVSKETVDSVAQTFEFQSSDDNNMIAERPNIKEEDEDSEDTTPSSPPQESQADLERTWLDKLLSFVGPLRA